MHDHTSPKTIRIRGKIQNQDVTILVDGGALITSFQESIVHFLNLSVSNSNRFNVMIKIGEKLVCNTQCIDVAILLTATIFNIQRS